MRSSHMTVCIILISIVPDESGSLTGKNMISDIYISDSKNRPNLYYAC
jgi:hypothetical protein